MSHLAKKTCLEVNIQRYPTVLILPMSLPCHILHIYKGAVSMVTSKHLLLYTIPIGSEERLSRKGPQEVICSSIPVLSHSASQRGMKSWQGVRRICCFQEAPRKNYYLGPTSPSKVRSPLLQRWGVSPHSPHNTFLPFFLCTSTLQHPSPPSPQEILLACLLYQPKHLFISGSWLMPVLGATSSCPSSLPRSSQEGHKPHVECPGFSWRFVL